MFSSHFFDQWLDQYTIWNEENLSIKLSKDVSDARDTVLGSNGMNPVSDAWVFLAKFTVPHQSHRDWFMPRNITRLDGWVSSRVLAIRKSAKPLPAILPKVEKIPALVKVSSSKSKKVSLPPTGRRFAMGRGVDLSKKAVAVRCCLGQCRLRTTW